EEYEGMIIEMKKAAYEAHNTLAYDKVAAEIAAVETKLDAAIVALEEEYPGIDLTEWKEVIGGQLADAKKGAEQALAAANDNGELFNFPFSGEEYEGMVAEMQKQVPNQAAYDKVMASINAVEADYDEAKEAVKEVNPDFDMAEWEEIINAQIAQAKEGADQALANSTEEGEPFNYAFGADDIEASIIEMKKAAFESHNTLAYDKVAAEIAAVETKLEAAVVALEEEYPGIDLAEWKVIIGGQLADAKKGAEQALASANDNGELFNFPFSAEEYEGMIAEMQKTAPDQSAYSKVMASINAVETDYDEAKETIKEVNPDFDMAEWEEIIGGQITDAKKGAQQALDNSLEDGEEFNFTFGADDIKDMITEMKKAAFEAPNKAAYDKVAAEVAAVETKLEAAVVALEEEYPGIDLTEWKEIIGGQLADAKKGAEQALAAANEDGELYSFPFSADEYEGMIAEMQKAAPNQAAYDKVMASINAIEADYDEAKETIKEVNPDFDMAEWEEIIGGQIADAKKGAQQALANANEDGEAFSYAFGAEDIEAALTEMKKAAFEAPNTLAYDKVVDAIAAVEAKYMTAVVEIEMEYPGFDLTEWKEIIGGQLEEVKKGAEQALAAANEDGELYNYPFDAEEYEGMIAEMQKAASDLSSIDALEAEVAAGNAKIYTLDGKAHFAPVRGQVNVIVRGNSTVKVMIK
ncbi:MAG: hypothetical protein K2J63_00930, partial [Muribaculaceae bacterium]|nr:hypothetical protein [Muribaculaceae bacterium]